MVITFTNEDLIDQSQIQSFTIRSFNPLPLLTLQRAKGIIYLDPDGKQHTVLNNPPTIDQLHQISGQFLLEHLGQGYDLEQITYFFRDLSKVKS